MNTVLSNAELSFIAAEIYRLMRVEIAGPALAANPAPAPFVPIPVPAPVATVAALPVTKGVTFTRVDDRRIDDIVPAGTPGTVQMVKTGHVLSIPQPKAEGWGAYLCRVHKQCGSHAPRTAMNTDQDFAVYGGFKEDGSNWPIVADYIYNGLAYADPAKLAATAAYNASIAAAQGGGDGWLSGPGGGGPTAPAAPETVFIDQ